MPTKKTAQIKTKAATKPAASKPAAKKSAAPAVKKAEAPKSKPKPQPKPAPVLKEKSSAKQAKSPPPAPKAPAKAVTAPKPAKGAPKPAAKVKAPPAKPAEAPVKPLAKQRPAPAPKAEAPAAPSKLQKPAKAERATAPRPAAAPRLDAVEAAFAKPQPSRPLAVAAGRAQPLAKALTTPPPRTAPKSLAAPKPSLVEAEEIAGDLKPVPAFKAAKPANGQMVLIGAVGGAFGVKGEIRLRAFTDRPEGVISYGPLYGEDGKVLLKPKSWRGLKDGVAVVAPEVKTREQAEQMRGQRVFVPRVNLPKPGEDDEYYWVDLMGCRAEALDGAPLGEVVAVWNFGAGDILELRPPNGGPNVRISFTKENVPLVDPIAKRIVVDPPAPEPLGK